MSTLGKPLLACLLAGVWCVSCTKTGHIATQATPATTALTTAEQINIAKAGFSPTGAIKRADGYLVEGDILLTAADLERLSGSTNAAGVNIARTEQYRTIYLVKQLPRVISIAVNAGASDAVFKAATDTAIARYNKLQLLLQFKRVSTVSSADIVIQGSNLGDGVLGMSAGFPDSSGKPAASIQLNNTYYTAAYQDIKALGTVIAHEVGHAIGFRHTDYKDRSFSCGRTPWYDFLKLLGINVYDEGSSDVGAILIAGTPSGPDALSWMLACGGSNRPFNANDVKALKAVY